MALTASELAIVSRLLDEALPLDANARAQWLGALPAEHERLAPVLSRLLLEESAARSGGLLGRPPPLEGRDAQELLSPVSGERVGPYRLIRELGRGGMGAVWLADRADGAYTRRVAVKLPRLSWAPELAGRIRRERDLLAALEHPNIARLYDAGVDALGRPYLALEYVEGRAIDRFCRESDLSVRERLHLFLEVARAVTYAHARLIVHRDLKPSNILVGADRTVHLLDFGIGKLLESETTRPTQLTELGGHALTPDYASPEQLRGGPITVGSDVYSLGVLLYELLTGERPFAPASASGPGQTHPSEGADAPLASHRTSDPSTKRILRGDLDTILAKALKRDPVDRYASVEAFAADLQRFLDGNAVLARPDSAGYRVAKFARRHWWGVAATGAVLTTLIAGAAVSLWEAEQAAKEAERARLVKDYIVDMFRLSARAETRAAEAPAHAAELLLERGARQIETRFARQPALQAELLGAVGNIFLGLGQSRQATEMATKQLTLLERVAAPPLQRALALRTLARAQIQEQRLDEAAATLRTALRGLGGESVADEAELRALLAWCLILRWQVDQARAELDTADASLKGAGIADSRAEGEIAFARAYLLLAEERFAEARPLFERATRLFDQIEGELSARAIEVRDLYARALLGNSQIDDGRGIYEHLIAALRNAFGPLNLQAAELELEMTRWIMLRGLMRQEHEGIRRLENVKRVLEQQGERVPRQLAARADLTLAWAYATDGQIMRGDRLVAESTDYFEKPLEGIGARYHARMLYAEWLLLRGRHREAVAMYDSNLEIVGRASGAFDSDIVLLHTLAAGDAILSGELAVGEQRLKQASARFGSLPDNDNGRWVQLLWHQVAALLEFEQGRPSNTLAETAQVASLAAHLPRGFHATYGTAYEELALQRQAAALCSLGRVQEGTILLWRDIASGEHDHDSTDPLIASARAGLGLCLLKAGDRARTKQLATLARKALDEQPGVSPYFTRPLLDLERRLRLAAGR